MNSKRLSTMAIAMVGAALSGGSFYGSCSRSSNPPETTPERFKRDKEWKALEKTQRLQVNGSLKSFEINGEKILALNYKNALKKYNKKFGPKS